MPFKDKRAQYREADRDSGRRLRFSLGIQFKGTVQNCWLKVDGINRRSGSGWRFRGAVYFREYTLELRFTDAV